MFSFFEVLIPFLLMHVICDFYLQPMSWIEEKKQKTYRSLKLYYHALLHGFSLTIPALTLGIDWYSTTCFVALVAISHFLIDWWKVSTGNENKLSYFIVDQVLHLSVLVLIAFHLSKGLTIEGILKHDKFADAVMVLFAYLLVLKPVSIVISNVLRKYPIAATKQSEVSGLVAGGELIGYLERVLILTFTLVGSYAAVGFVLAAKSIFRFGDLNKINDRSMTEYVLIGSLLSVVTTILIGTLVALGIGVKIK